MSWIKYILYCMWDTILLGNSRVDLVNSGFKEFTIGIFSIIFLGIVFTFFNLKVFRGKKLSTLYSFLSTIGIAILCFGIIILLDFIIK